MNTSGHVPWWIGLDGTMEGDYWNTIITGSKMNMDPIAVTASMISLARFLMEQIDRHNAGELTDEQLEKAWKTLQVRRDRTKAIWEDAKAAGGYTGVQPQ